MLSTAISERLSAHHCVNVYVAERDGTVHRAQIALPVPARGCWVIP